MRLLIKITGTTLASLYFALNASAQQWPESFVARVEVLALIQTLNVSLLASRSATATLEKWCAQHHMSAEPKIIARRVAGVDKPPSAETLEHLGVSAAAPLKYRRVQLICGGHVLSEADNWYVPARLSAEMNHELETTETPFGKAVAALHPFRRTIEMKMRWSPLPDGWELSPPDTKRDAAAGGLAPPHELFEHWAVLYGDDQKPFSEVHETYTSEILAFEPPSRGADK
jgi:chorismate-pyruvate lyase